MDGPLPIDPWEALQTGIVLAVVAFLIVLDSAAFRSF